MKKYLSLVFVLILLFSCETEPQTDYVELVIPAELQNNKEAVEQLESDAKQLNKVFNSAEEIMLNITRFKDDIRALDEQTDSTAFRKQMKKRVEQVEWSIAKFAFNIWWLGLKDYNTEQGHREIISKLSKREALQFNKCLKHLEIKQDVVKQKFEKFSKEMKELSQLIDKKTALLDKNIKQQPQN